MTLIAAWIEHGTPYLIGDVLVTNLSDFGDEEHFRLPTRDDLNDVLPREKGVRIIGALQKAYKVSDTFAIGWAGNTLAARTAVRDIFAEFQGKSPSVDDVRDFLSNPDYAATIFCIIIGWIVEEGTPYCFRWRSNAPNNFEIGDSFFEGTGNEHLREILRPSGASGKEPLVNSVLGKLANLLGHEIFYGGTLLSLFGGGYELIYYDEGRFNIVPSATFIFMFATEREKDVLMQPGPKHLKSHYANGVLVTMAISENADSTREVVLHYAYSILQNQENAVNEQQALSLVSDYYALFIAVTGNDGVEGEHVTTFSDKNKASTLRIDRSPEGIETMVLNRQKLLQIAQSIADRNRDRAAYPTRERLTRE